MSLMDLVNILHRMIILNTEKHTLNAEEWEEFDKLQEEFEQKSKEMDDEPKG